MVVGTSGSGKSTLARTLSEKLGLAHIELDALFWEKNWVQTPREVFRSHVDEATKQDAWAACGNAGAVRDFTWGRADTLVWLDYSFPVVFGRALKRTVVRAITREEICNGNRESWRMSFLSSQSILLWVIQTYRRRKREYPEFLKLPEFAHLKVVHLTSQHETNRWLDELKH